MKLENIESVQVSQSTKEWVRRIVELDELEDNIKKTLNERIGDEAATSRVLGDDFIDNFDGIRQLLLKLIGENIYENMTDICSTEI